MNHGFVFVIFLGMLLSYFLVGLITAKIVGRKLHLRIKYLLEDELNSRNAIARLEAKINEEKSISYLEGYYSGHVEGYSEGRVQGYEEGRSIKDVEAHEAKKVKKSKKERQV